MTGIRFRRARRRSARRCARPSSRPDRARRTAARPRSPPCRGPKLPRSKSSATIGSASTISPMVAGTFSISISERPLRQRLRTARQVLARAVPRDRRQRRGRDRDAEQTDRQVHEPERVTRAMTRRRCLLARGQHGVDEQVDLRGGQADRAWPHQHQHPVQPFVAPVERRRASGSLPGERRPLDGELADAAQQRADRDHRDRLKTEARLNGTNATAHDDRQRR